MEPCRALILATLPDGSVRKVRIPKTGYNAQRHVDRWLSRGAVRVVCWLFSTSTGREIVSVSGQQEKFRALLKTYI